MSKVRYSNFSVQQISYLDAVRFIELNNLLQEPISLVYLALLGSLLETLKFEYLVNNLRELVVNNVVLVYFIPSSQHCRYAGQYLLGRIDH